MKRVFEAIRAICEDGVARRVEGADLLAGAVRDIDWSREIKTEPPRMMPVVESHLDDLAAIAGDGVAGDFTRVLVEVADRLNWRDIYPHYAGEPDMDAFRRNYAFIHFIGPRGMVECDTTLFAISLQGPRTFYPCHVHKPPEEYFVAAGEAEWQRGDGAWARKPPGSFFHHPSGARHATKTLDQPLLCVIAWFGDLTSQVVIVRE